MPQPGVSVEFDQRIEDWIAELLDARQALTAIDALFLANLREGYLTPEEHSLLADDVGAIRRGIEIGLRLGRMVRNPPPDLEAKFNRRIGFADPP